jgi:hypothetical protein
VDSEIDVDTRLEEQTHRPMKNLSLLTGQRSVRVAVGDRRKREKTEKKKNKTYWGRYF